jgi:endoglucanase
MKTLVLFLLVLLPRDLFAEAHGVIRANQLGYTPSSVKVAVAMLDVPPASSYQFELRDALTDSVVFHSTCRTSAGPYGRFPTTLRLDFSRFQKSGGYYLQLAEIRSPVFRIGEDVYDGAADFLLKYMREQRSGFNPFLRDSCHTHDGYVIYRPGHDSEYVDVVGGWHDASDYLQYVTTSATATYQMLFAYQQHPGVFGDRYGASGLPGTNGIPDILDEAAWGLRWLLKMNPAPGVMYNQIADDRDHQGFRLPTEDPVDYGKGKERPVYFCTGKPQGLFQYKNQSTGLASTAGKFASAFALGAKIFAARDPALARVLLDRARSAFQTGEEHPGVCQTAPCKSPYYYEEDDWADDMELAAAQLAQSTGERTYLREAEGYGRQEPVKPWMGEAAARHYQWYPFINLGHVRLAQEDPHARKEFIAYLREGIERVRARAIHHPFRMGIPFIWCSNNYVSAFLAQLQLYRSMSGDTSYRDLEAAARDWLFGCNPWGTSMIIGLPRGGVSPKDPHSALSHLYGYHINGGLIDGPVRATIFNALKGIQLSHADPFAPYQGEVVYHDDWGDYSSNEPTMDGTAGLTMALAALEEHGKADPSRLKRVVDEGGIVRGDTTTKVIYLAFTGHEFADGGMTIAGELKHVDVKASFFFTGAFYRDPKNTSLIQRLRSDGHYLGPHSDGHLLYAPWDHRDSTLVTEDHFNDDLRRNYAAMADIGIRPAQARVFLPPFEWYNRTVADWTKRLGLTLIDFTPGTYSNADYTTPSMGPRYLSSDTILARILRFESTHRSGLNGFVLLMHVGTDPERTDKVYDRLEGLLNELKRRGYRFDTVRQLVSNG